MRRQTRSIVQFGILITAIFLLVWIADSRYRVLPEKLHNSLPLHHVGTVITDITIQQCSSINLLSSCQLDPEEWHRVEKDLYLQSGWTKSAWLHVQRKKEEELTVKDRIVINLRISKVDPGIGEKGQETEKWESRPGGIWLLRGNSRVDSDPVRAVTGVDVLFGADAVDPRQGWTMSTTPLMIDSDPKLHPARITIRHGNNAVEKPSPPRVSKEGKFKILQWSDAHLATGVGKCRDTIDETGKSVPNCEADIKTLDFVERVLDAEQPDLVVLSGDQVEGPEALDTQSAILKYAAPLIEREIPYATIFGNHDDEGQHSLSRSSQMSIVETLPFSLSQPGPQNLPGVGNYYVEVLAHSGQHSAITVYLLDSHGLSPDERKYKGYDWIKTQQIEWFNSTADSLKKSHQKYSHIHLDLAFIHIPLPEYAESGLLITGGRSREPVTAPGFNSHFYDALASNGVSAVGCGHDHVNDYCALRVPASGRKRSPDEDSPAGHSKTHLGPWMCYAGGSGFGGYGGYGGYHRRVRIWEIDTNAGRITTWKRVECCGDETKKKIDELVIVEGGVVITNGD